MNTATGRGLAATAALVTVVSLSACASSSGSGGGDPSGPIVLGATLSLTGPLGTIGPEQEAGYQQYVADINGAGGLRVGKTKRLVKLVVLDNRSDPTQASQQASELILKDNAVALLGAATPTITVPVGLVADKNQIPYVTSSTPVKAFAAGNKAGWEYSWDFFFSEDEQAAIVFAGARTASSNKKVALFTDTEPDGTVERGLYKEAAAKDGFNVVGDYTFPVGTSDFTSFINDAKSKGAQVVVAQMIPPDGIAMVKQMKSLGFAPRFIAVEKAADTPAWLGLDALADGTVHQWFWSPALNRPGTAHIERTLGKKYPHISDLDLALAAYDTAAIVCDAIQAAGTTDASQVNSAIKATNKDYTFARIHFGADHTDATQVVLAQWQGDKDVQVYPPVAGVHLEVPPKGIG